MPRKKRIAQSQPAAAPENKPVEGSPIQYDPEKERRKKFVEELYEKYYGKGKNSNADRLSE